MSEFYRDNVKYSLKILYYKYVVLLALVVPVLVIMGGILLALSKINRDLFNIVAFCAIVAFVLLVLLSLLGVIWNFLFITGYSLLKNEQEERKIFGIWFDIGRKLTNWKFLLIVFVVFLVAVTISALLYFYVIPHSDLYRIIKLTLIVAIKLAITAIIASLLLFFIIKRSFIWNMNVHFIRTIGGVLWKIFIIILVLLAAIVFLGIIYWGVSLIFDPILNPMFGISGEMSEVR